MSKRLQVFFRAVRPFSFTGSIVPVALGAIFAIKETTFHLGYFLLSILAIVLLHSGANLLNDYYDFSNKVDTKDSYGSSGVILDGLMSPRQILYFGYTLFALGIFLGILLSVLRGMFILIIGVLGVLGGYFYTAKPFALKYKALGTPLIFLIFGPLMVIGGYFIQTQRVSVPALLISIPVGLLTTAILHANDIRDIYNDKKAGIKTLSIVVGENTSHIIYYILIVVSYLSIVFMVLYRLIPVWSLLCLITAPGAVKNINRLYFIKNSSDNLITFDKETAELHSKFGVIFILSILLPLIFK